MANRRTPHERAIIYAGVLGGLSREAIVELLSAAGLQNNVPETTIKSIRRHEVPVWLIKPEKLGQHIYHPETRSALRALLTEHAQAISADQSDNEEPEM